MSTSDNDLDRYLKESCKSYKGCRIKNSARRSSLQKKTLGIEAEKRLAAVSMSKEEKQLREHLKRMQIDRARNRIVHHMREQGSNHFDVSNENEEEKIQEVLRVPVEPYPVTISPRTSPKLHRGKTSIDEQGKSYSQQRARRFSRELEDLHMNTHTGNLQESANMAKILLGKSGSINTPLSRSLVTIKRVDSPQISSRNSSRGSLQKLSDDTNSSSSAISSLEDLHWICDPQATKSVRRPRKTIKEQDVSSELFRLSKKKTRKPKK